jgi:hypothetical protein
MQFGRTLHQLLRHIIWINPCFGPLYLSKQDIANGFYRIWLLPHDVTKLGMLFPRSAGEEQLVGFHWLFLWDGFTPLHILLQQLRPSLCMTG